MMLLDEDMHQTLELVRNVRAAVEEDANCTALMHEAIRANATGEAREKLGIRLRDARQALADARVKLIEHAMGAAFDPEVAP